MDRKSAQRLAFDCRARPDPARSASSPRPVGPRRRGVFPFMESCFVDTDHFQPMVVFFGCVPDEVHSFNVSPLPVTLGEID